MSSKQKQEVASKKRVYETNELKKDVLRRIETGESLHKLASTFKISRSTIQGWIKKKEEIMEAPDSRKHSKFNPKYEILERIIVEFLRKARERGVCVTGPMLITNAQMKAKQLGIEGFSGSDGWLTRVKERSSTNSVRRIQKCQFDHSK